MKENNEEEKILLELQKKYEDGIIVEKDLSSEEKERLISLYKVQICNLKSNITDLKKDLEYYKNKIIEIKNNK